MIFPSVFHIIIIIIVIIIYYFMLLFSDYCITRPCSVELLIAYIIYQSKAPSFNVLTMRSLRWALALLGTKLPYQ